MDRSLTTVSDRGRGGDPAPVQPLLHAAHRRARRVVPRHRAAPRPVPRCCSRSAPPAPGVVELRRRLGLDSGYLSRLLRQLERDDLITLYAPIPRDRRQRVVALSPTGGASGDASNAGPRTSPDASWTPLSTRQRAELASALTTAERLLRAATIDLELVDPRSPIAQAALAHYFDELDQRFPSGFDPGAAGATDVAALRTPHGAFVVVRSDETTVGCGGVQRIDEATGEIKRMWIDPDWRGLGLGSRLLARLEDIGPRARPHAGRPRHQ